MSGVMRVLCLHGKHQTKETFRSRIGKLPNRAKHVAEFVYVDGPHELPKREGEDVATRSWWMQGDEVATVEATLAELRGVWKELGPFDGVLGFSMGGALACALATRLEEFPGLSFVIAAGAPAASSIPGLWKGSKCTGISLPSLHIFGTSDQVVPVSSSTELASRFVNPELYEHPQGHCLPSNRPSMDTYVAFLEKVHASLQIKGESCLSIESAQEQQDELEALVSMYPEKISILTPAPEGAGAPCAKFEVSMETSADSPLQGKPLKLAIALPADYPNDLPLVKLQHSFSVLDFPEPVEQSLVTHMESEMEVQKGMPCVFSAITAAEEWLVEPSNFVYKPVAASNPAPQAPSKPLLDEEPAPSIKIWEEESEETESKLVSLATEEACNEVARRLKKDSADGGQVAIARSVRRFVVGLVGKPSAGKSTFFNCVTRLQSEAKVAAHPFTTIEPNFGTGWWASPDAQDRNAGHGARYGRDAQGRRLLPLLIKDVAGLIPGAYKGQGKGNRFLNDLCDADVLIHVVDVSGTSDKNGVAVLAGDATASSAAEDIAWVREELHRWIFGNVSGKWQSVVRAAKQSTRRAEERVLELFSGYQGSKDAVQTAIFRAKLDILTVHNWTREDLHRVVAHFLSVRFPMCLALNKCDKLLRSGGEGRIAEAKSAAEEKGYLGVSCSAMTETKLLHLANLGAIEYDLGSTNLKIIDETKLSDAFKNDAAAQERFLSNAHHVLEKLDGTGVMDCISAAVQLRKPVLVYPVSDLHTGAPIMVERGAGAHHGLPFRDCLQALPGTTIEDVFTALKRNAIEDYKLDGDLIRIEARNLAPRSPVTQCGKDTPVAAKTCVIKFLTNKKPLWQSKLAEAAAKSPSEK